MPHITPTVRSEPLTSSDAEVLLASLFAGKKLRIKPSAKMLAHGRRHFEAFERCLTAAPDSFRGTGAIPHALGLLKKRLMLDGLILEDYDLTEWDLWWRTFDYVRKHTVH